MRYVLLEVLEGAGILEIDLMINVILHTRSCGSGRENAIQSQEAVSGISQYGVEVIREAAGSRFNVRGLGDYR